MFLSGCELTDLCMSLLWRRRQELHHIKVLEAAAVRVLRDKLDKPKATGLLCLSKHHLSQLFAPLVVKKSSWMKSCRHLSLRQKRSKFTKTVREIFIKNNIKWFSIIQMKEKRRTGCVEKRSAVFSTKVCCVYSVRSFFDTLKQHPSLLALWCSASGLNRSEIFHKLSDGYCSITEPWCFM